MFSPLLSSSRADELRPPPPPLTLHRHIRRGRRTIGNTALTGNGRSETPLVLGMCPIARGGAVSGVGHNGDNGEHRPHPLKPEYHTCTRAEALIAAPLAEPRIGAMATTCASCKSILHHP